MTLLITVFAAIVSTLVWYLSEKARKLHIGTLVLMYWGAALMWMCDAVFEYAELRDAYFTPAAEDMINDGFLGFSVVALGLVIWIAIVMIKDPSHVLKVGSKAA
ncbi:MAG: hypothetical protein K5739_08645 [Lachnospiraceae bacterium]|nr:hypothetical protein [Lachnospiraceae bacterium]